MAISRYVLGL